MSIRKKPWNRVNLPVYAVTSTDGNGSFNMHIITYVTQVSMQPKMFICGIYKGTKTLALIQKHPRFVLQILPVHLYKLVNVLGKKTGHSYNKMNYLAKKDLVMQWNGFPVLKDALAVLELSATSLKNQTSGVADHEIYLCEVLAYTNLNSGTVLTLDDLRANKIISI